MAFVLVQHLAPSHKSMLVELLEPNVPLPITVAHDGVEVVKNRIYVIPQDATLTMVGNILRVDSPAPERAHRRPIDSFFRPLLKITATVPSGSFSPAWAATGRRACRRSRSTAA